MLLVGTDRDRIIAEARRLLTDRPALSAMSLPAFPYGNGTAAARIADIIRSWIAG
jgi:UDP-N-acetylglucosamine 2-epimerase (non-hydrolysing)